MVPGGGEGFLVGGDLASRSCGAGRGRRRASLRSAAASLARTSWVPVSQAQASCR